MPVGFIPSTAGRGAFSMIHPLKTADAFQLSAALIWAEESTKDQVLICLDHNLREAAQREGFTVLSE